MAQMNQQNNMRPQNTQSSGNRQSHSWSFDNVAKKDLNKSQWPFKVVRDKGKPTKMEIRSLTDLNRSFDGTPYNLNDCPRVKSRYSLLFDRFSLINKNEDVTSCITHLLLTYDAVYYLVQKKDGKGPELRGFTYGSDCLKQEDLNGLLSNVLYRSKYLDNNIKQAFKLYNDSEDMVYYNSLRKEVELYLNVRKKLRVLDNSKPIIDVLKSELNFTNLQYLVFMPYPEIAKDYQSLILEGLMRNNIEPTSIPEMMEELKKLPTLNSEIQGVEEFKKGLDRKDYYKSIRKVYMLGPRELTKENVWNLFKSITSDKFSVEPIYISEAEQKRIEKEMVRKEKDYNDIMQAKNEVKCEIKANYVDIMTMIFSMNDIFKTCNLIHEKGLEQRNVEYDIWIKYYKPSLISTYVDSVYNYRMRKSNKPKNYPISTILKAMQSHSDFAVNFITVDDIDFFNTNLVPTYFKDDRRSLDSIECSNFNAIAHLKNLNTILKDIKSEMFVLFESFLGTEYALFGMFMKRYGIGGIEITKILIKNFVNKYQNKYFNITENVKECANSAFYMLVTNTSNLDEYDPVVAASSDEKAGIGEFSHFVVKYLTEISGKTPNTLVPQTTSSKEVEMLKYKYLFETLFSVVDIIDLAKSLVYLDTISGSNLERILAVIGSECNR